jgi:LPXTG-motif cell wall-anchored protein
VVTGVPSLVGGIIVVAAALTFLKRRREKPTITIGWKQLR